MKRLGMLAAVMFVWALVLGPQGAAAQPDDFGPGEGMERGHDDFGGHYGPGDDDWGPRRRGKRGRRGQRGRRGGPDMGHDDWGGEGEYGERGGPHGKRMRKKMRRRQKMKKMGRKFMHKMKNDPEAQKVMQQMETSQRRLKEVAHAYRRAEDEKKKKELKPDLEKAVEAVFEAKMAGYDLKLKHMREQLAKLEERVAKKRKLKSQIIKKKVDQMTGKEDELDW